MPDSPTGGYFIRMLSCPKWPDGENSSFESVEKLPADLITNDLKTTRDQLSWWYAENNDKDSLIRIATALTSSFKLKPDEPIMMISVPAGTLAGLLTLKQSSKDAKTALIDAKRQHYDSMNMICADLEELAEEIAKATSGDNSHFEIHELNLDDITQYMKEQYAHKNVAINRNLGLWAREVLGIESD